MTSGNNWQPRDDEVARLLDRIRALEAALLARLDSLEGAVKTWDTREEEAHTLHRARAWQVALAIITGLVLPLATIGIVALLHLITN